jgi:hypothetical protein
MENNKIDDVKVYIQDGIDKLNEKDVTFYFFTLDCKGIPNAGIANIYEHVKLLREIGLKSAILHEKNDYTSVESWLGDEYSDLPHYSIESQEIKVGISDFLIIPEIFSNVMEQTMNMPCKRLVFSQSYDYILELLMPGKTWFDYGLTDCVTTSEKQKEYIDNLFSGVIDTKVVPVAIPDYFKESGKLQKPIVAISCRDNKDLLRIFKTFYVKYPHLKWISFRDMKELPREDFARELSDCCLSVWIDDISSYGTFPLESIKCGVPVIGKVPNLQPEWMTNDNGMWTYDILKIPEMIATYVQLWLEDALQGEVIENMKKTKIYTTDEQKSKVEEIYNYFIQKRITELENKLPKTQEA